MITKYILDAGHQPVEEPDLLAWAKWLGEDDHRRVARAEGDGWEVSTVFLGFDHGMCWKHSGLPVLFETMRFDDSGARIMGRCSTWDGALAMHEAAVKEAESKQ